MNHIPKEVASTILLTIYRGGKLTMSEIYEKTKFSTITILNHVNAMITAGLLEEEREAVFPRRRLIKATGEGTRVAALLNMADRGMFCPGDLIDMGAKAGRIAAYQEELASVKKANVSREYLIAELLLKGIAVLSGGTSAIAKGLPAEATNEKAALQAWSVKLERHHSNGLKFLGTNDYAGCIREVSKALNEFNASSEVFKSISKMLKESKFDEIANYVEFISPKAT